MLGPSPPMALLTFAQNVDRSWRGGFLPSLASGLIIASRSLAYRNVSPLYSIESRVTSGWLLLTLRSRKTSVVSYKALATFGS